jgi:putative oxidoreductase
MHKATWVVQVILGVYFIAIGVVHLVVPDGLPQAMGWMHDLPAWAHYLSGIMEILGGLGLVLPGLTGIRPQLTLLAASGLAVVMVLAAGWHASRGEVQNVVTNIVVLAVLAFVAYVRWRKHPLPAR